jgi:hypothetical protein
MNQAHRDKSMNPNKRPSRLTGLFLENAFGTAGISIRYLRMNPFHFWSALEKFSNSSGEQLFDILKIGLFAVEYCQRVRIRARWSQYSVNIRTSDRDAMTWNVCVTGDLQCFSLGHRELCNDFAHLVKLSLSWGSAQRCIWIGSDMLLIIVDRTVFREETSSMGLTCDSYLWTIPINLSITLWMKDKLYNHILICNVESGINFRLKASERDRSYEAVSEVQKICLGINDSQPYGKMGHLLRRRAWSFAIISFVVLHFHGHFQTFHIGSLFCSCLLRITISVYCMVKIVTNPLLADWNPGSRSPIWEGTRIQKPWLAW